MRTEYVAVEDVKLAHEYVFHFKPHGYSGRGGHVVGINDKSFVLISGTAQFENLVMRDDVHHITREVPYDAQECLEYSDACDGPVDDHWAGGINGRTWPRCTFHADQRERRYEESMERYADSDVVPDWFDPSYAGEHWDEDY